MKENMPFKRFILIKAIFFSIFIIGLFSNAFSQIWPMPGAQWTYCLSANGGPAGEILIKVTGDTIIDSKSYSIIEHIENKSSNDVHPFRTLFTRYENDTIYRFVNNQEYLYFTYNLEIGDVFTTYRSSGWMWNDTTCSSILPLKVIEINEIELDGEIFNSYILEDTLFHYLYDDPNYPEPILYNLVERIGVINTFPFLNTLIMPSSCEIFIEYSTVTLGNYSDNNYEYTFKECEGIGIDEIEKDQLFTIYPNPAEQELNIVYNGIMNQEYEVSLINLLGKKIDTFNLADLITKINVSKHPSGYYVFLLRNKKTHKIEQNIKLIIL